MGPVDSERKTENYNLTDPYCFIRIDPSPTALYKHSLYTKLKITIEQQSKPNAKVHVVASHNIGARQEKQVYSVLTRANNTVYAETHQSVYLVFDSSGDY